MYIQNPSSPSKKGAVIIGIICLLICLNASAAMAWNCCQVGSKCYDNMTVDECKSYNGIFYGGATCVEFNDGKFCCNKDDKDNWVKCKPNAIWVYNTGASNGCGGRQFVAHNYPSDAPEPQAPQLAEVTVDGDVITLLYTVRIYEPSLLTEVMFLFQDSGWLAQDEVVVVWGFGTDPMEGSFPGTFCYAEDQYYGVIDNNAIPPECEDAIAVASWYSDDTLSIPESMDFTTVGILPPDRPIPATTEWGMFFLVLFLIGIAFAIIMKRRHALV